MEGNQRIRRFKSDAKGCPGYRETSRHFETKLARDLMDKCADEERWQKFGTRHELTAEETEYQNQCDEAMARQKEIEYEIDDNRLEEEVEAIIRSGDLSMERIGCRKI
ncbi:hypothetical protein MKX03_026127 [Papaver bracteatum]|nr:hypothetical protein MKX03_026127 [Papaver bracteatum]